MKLGVAYNIFDGQEMLIHSVANLRPMVDYICIIFQDVSNFGNRNPKLRRVIKDLVNNNMVEDVYCYQPIFPIDPETNRRLPSVGFDNELNKRNIGLDLCRYYKCDAFMSVDCDELYDPTQFEWAKKDFERYGYDTSFTKMKTYYKHPTIELYPPEEYYAPLFYRIHNDTKFDLKYYNADYPANIDPTRRIKAGDSRLYSREEIEMYHYAYVRKSIRTKVENSSSQSSDEHKDKVCYHYDHWKGVEDKALFIGNVEHTLKEVENKFNIEI